MHGLIELSGSLYTDCLKIAEYSSCKKLVSFISLFFIYGLHILKVVKDLLMQGKHILVIQQK